VIVSGTVLPVDKANVDTDQIIPAHCLTGVETSGLGKHLFAGMPGGRDLLAQHPGASIVVTRENFGCGSSREHAVWALEDCGFRAVIAPSFARIFWENCYNRGVSPIEVSADEIDALLAAPEIAIDLTAERLRANGREIAFSLDPLRKQFVLEGGYYAYLASKRDGVRAWLAARGVTAGAVPIGASPLR